MASPVLRFNEKGQFRILMFSDIHAGKNCSQKTVDGIEALLANTNPDLVLIGGDQCLEKETPDEVRAYFMRIIEPVLKRNLPWAAIFGNHDRECGISVEEEQAVYESIPGCISEAGPDDINGTGNYCLTVFANKADTPAYHIFALDSFSETRDYVRLFNIPKDTRFILPEHFGSAHAQASVMFDQVMWYFEESERREREANKKIPAIMTMHVPPIEFCLVDRNPEETDARGNRRESPACGEMNPGLFAACLQRGDVKGIFCGHEHLNDYQGTYCGITLAYDAAIGYNMSAHDDLRGGRIIDLYENGFFTTKTVKLIDLMGKDAMRDPDYFEGGSRYIFRQL